MRQATWAVMVFVVVFNARVALYTSSPNFAAGYATGLAAAWGIISTLNVLVWSSPQEDAARIVRRKIARTDNGGILPNGHSSHHSGQEQEPRENGLRHRKANDIDASSLAEQTPEHDHEYEYVWQSFPRTGSLLSRLNWALDMTTNFRFAGMYLPTYSPPNRRLIANEDNRLELGHIGCSSTSSRCANDFCGHTNHAHRNEGWVPPQHHPIRIPVYSPHQYRDHISVARLPRCRYDERPLLRTGSRCPLPPS